MNRHQFILYLTFLFALGLSACDEEYKTVFDQQPDERVQNTLDEYNTLLTDAPYGWKARLKTGIGRCYFYYFKFSDDGNVTMISDFNETTAATAATSSWVIKALQRPTLSFNTYSYIHLPADPSSSVSGGTNGQGLVSDFEFAFDGQSGDSILFTGIQHGAGLYFLPATQQEANEILDQQIYNVLAGTRQMNENSKGLQLMLPDGQKVPVVIDVDQRVFGAQYLTAANDDIVGFQSGFTFSINGVELETPFEIGGHTIEHLVWDEQQQTFSVNLDGSTAITAYTEPFVFEVTPPLYTSLGEKYSGIVIPEGSGSNPLPGQSDEFLDAYNAAAAAILAGEYQLTLRDMTLVFDPENQIMELDIVISQTGGGATNLFLAQYGYGYTIDEEGLIKFTFQGANQNGWLIYGDLYSMLFKLESDTFRAEYVGGDLNLIGALFSEENPGFYFSGYLINNQ